MGDSFEQKAPAPTTTPEASAKPLTDAQIAILRLLDKRAGITELFAPNTGTLRVLRERGLIRCSFVGMRWWKAVITKAGHSALAEVDHA